MLKELEFVFAKTMPKIPHEYVVRTEANEQEYIELFNTIKEKGVYERWGKRQYQYYYAGDGYKYWAMTKDINKSIIINRCEV